MKTIYITNIRDQKSAADYQVLLDHFQERNGSLPDDVRREKLYQAILQISLLGYEGEAYGFFETSIDEGRPLTLSDLEGSISVRVDFDPNSDADLDHPDQRCLPDNLRVSGAVVMALTNPNSHPQFPEKGLIDHMRVAIRVEDTIVEHTYWATQYDLLKGLPDGVAIFGPHTIWEA